MKKMLSVLFLLLITPSISFGADLFSGSFSYVDGTNFNECPAGEFKVTKGPRGYSLYGTTGMNAWGPFNNQFYLHRIGLEPYKRPAGSDHEYVYETILVDNEIRRNTKFIEKKRQKVLLEEEIVFKVTPTTAVLKHNLIYNSKKSGQVRHSSFSCFYERDPQPSL